MIITIDGKNGRMRELSVDPAGLTPGSIQDRMIGHTADLRLDLIEETGELRLDLFWYSYEAAADTRYLDDEAMDIPLASRRLGRSILIIAKDEMEDVSKITVQRGGERTAALWRQGTGDWLIRGTAFEAAEVQCYRDARTASVNSRVYNLVNYLSKARPELTSGQIAELIGFPEEAVDEVYRWEGLNAPIEAYRSDFDGDDVELCDEEPSVGWDERTCISSDAS